MHIDNAIESRTDGPLRAVIHGPPGTGKTTLAAYLPRPVFIGAEHGIPRDLGFKVKELYPKSWADLLDTFDSLTFDEHDYQSAIVDTVDWFEPMLHKHVCERDSKRETEMNPKKRELVSIEDYGFGRGFLVSEEEFRELLRRADTLQASRGMHVALLMHSTVRTFKNPSGPDFDRYEPKSHAKIAALAREWAEAMLFLHYRVDAAKISEDKDRNKMSPDKARAKGIGGTEIIVGTRHSAMYDAKNRSGMPDELVLKDPNDVIDMLLAHHLAGDHPPIALRAQRETPHHAPLPSSSRPASRTVTELPRESEPVRPRTDYLRDEPAPQTQSAPATSTRPAPRQRDAEPQSGDAHLRGETQAVADRERDRSTSQPAQREDDRRGEQPRDQRSLDEGRGDVDKMIADTRRAAYKVKGQEYLDKVDGWIEKAQRDPARIAAIEARVAEDVRAELGVASPQQVAS